VTFSLSDAIQSVSRHLPAALVSRAGRRRLKAMAAALPDCGESLGFECTLTKRAAYADLGVSVTPTSGGPSALLAKSDPKLDELIKRDDRWRQLQNFIALWSDEASLLKQRVPFVFLEFDADTDPAAVPVPSIFVALDWQVQEMDRHAADPASAAVFAVDEVEKILQPLRGERLDARRRQMLLRCFETLPAGGLALHVGAMLGRPQRAVRLSMVVSRRDSASYLANLGWRAGLATLQGMLERYAPLADFEHPAAHVQIDFDVDSEVGERIGVSLRPHEESGWPALFDALVAERLCTPAKRDALLAWPGMTFDWFSGMPRPHLVRHYISHLKYACTSDARAAKAYFGVGPRDLPLRATAEESRPPT
jgi:hypothetical protein